MNTTEELGLRQVERKKYVKPDLVFYGEVSDLTMGGASTGSEGTSPGNTSKCANNVGIPCLPSDRRVKHRIERVGSHSSGIGLYLFEYLPELAPVLGAGRRFGVMADEVARVMPEAVREHPMGFKMVDYAMLGISPAVH